MLTDGDCGSRRRKRGQLERYICREVNILQSVVSAKSDFYNGPIKIQLFTKQRNEVDVYLVVSAEKAVIAQLGRYFIPLLIV